MRNDDLMQKYLHIKCPKFCTLAAESVADQFQIEKNPSLVEQDLVVFAQNNCKKQLFFWFFVGVFVSCIHENVWHGCCFIYKHSGTSRSNLNYLLVNANSLSEKGEKSK